MAQAGLAEESMAARARPLAEAPEARPLAEAEALRTIPLAEEDLHVERSAAQVGEVDIGKRVVEERRTIEVPVTREEVFIREHKVDRPAERPVGESFEAIRIPVNEERVSLQKEARVYGEIEVGKRKVTEQKQFTETVRREVPEVERKGDVERLVKSNLTEAERARLESQRASRELRR